MSKIKNLFVSVIIILFSGLTHAAGYVEGVSIVGTDFRIWGWACDQAAPNQVIYIHIWRDDNVFIGGGSADLWRESGVGAICGGSSQHGFYIKIIVPQSMLDNRNHVVRAFIVGGPSAPQLLPTIGSPSLYFAGTNQPNLPKNPGDVVGRDYQGSYVGHLGLWDGNQVIQMTGAKAGGGLPTISLQSIANFNLESNPWGAKNSNFQSVSVHRCYEASCRDSSYRTELPARLAVAARARQIWLIGADYTATAYFTPVRHGQSNPFDTIAPLRGMYRCDTLVVDSYLTLNPNWSQLDLYYKTVNNQPSDWLSKIGQVLNGIILPRNVFDRIGEAFK